MNCRGRIDLGLLAVLTSTACHRANSSDEMLSIQDFRYSARSAVVGPALDTLRVEVTVVNGSRKERFISVKECPPFMHPVKAVLRMESKAWSSEVSEIHKKPQYFDSTGKPIPQICLADLPGFTFPPGGSYTYVLKVPVAEVLGDSLPPGRYRVSAQLRLNGYLTRKLSAGDVELTGGAI